MTVLTNRSLFANRMCTPQDLTLTYGAVKRVNELSGNVHHPPASTWFRHDLAAHRAIEWRRNQSNYFVCSPSRKVLFENGLVTIEQAYNDSSGENGDGA